MNRTPIVISAVAAIAFGLGIAVAAVILDGGDRGVPAPAATGPAPATASAGAKPADPYAVYLKLAPKNAPKLSREDAQARAVLGCGQEWAPGTVDAALAKAYAGLCEGR
ncbi:hypothetical protein [Micromonospora sp. C41]|uniref:hypothetical protein n=1 Tax=Micromonospora sp. C41 TaxID=2824878 RepID=UPI001B36AF63|nr:hypothetical protein [Micromonospora sp. C41]MBQ1061338.1 hypothetical protein [Micromonospora sp. C41]